MRTSPPHTSPAGRTTKQNNITCCTCAEETKKKRKTNTWRQRLTWNEASYLTRASATEAVGGNTNQRWTAAQRFQSS